MDCVVSIHKNLHERLNVELIDLTESLSHQTKELLVSPTRRRLNGLLKILRLLPLLGAAVDDHVAELLLLTGLQVQLVQLVDGLLEVEGGLDGQVDRPSQGYQVGLRCIHDRLFLALLLVVIIV